MFTVYCWILLGLNAIAEQLLRDLSELFCLVSRGLTSNYYRLTAPVFCYSLAVACQRLSTIYVISSQETTQRILDALLGVQTELGCGSYGHLRDIWLFVPGK